MLENPGFSQQKCLLCINCNRKIQVLKENHQQ